MQRASTRKDIYRVLSKVPKISRAVYHLQNLQREDWEELGDANAKKLDSYARLLQNVGVTLQDIVQKNKEVVEQRRIPEGSSVHVSVGLAGMSTTVTITPKMSLAAVKRSAFKKLELPMEQVSNYRVVEGNTILDLNQQLGELGIQNGSRLTLLRRSAG